MDMECIEAHVSVVWGDMEVCRGTWECMGKKRDMGKEREGRGRGMGKEREG